MTHIKIEMLQCGTWAMTGKSGNVIATYASEADARADCRPVDELTPAQREARIGKPIDQKATADARNAALVDRLNNGLPLSKADAKEARRLVKEVTP